LFPLAETVAVAYVRSAFVMTSESYDQLVNLYLQVAAVKWKQH